LKGVNSSSLHDGLFDIGQDGKTSGSLPIVGRDAYGYMLDYYVGDYKPIGQQAFSLNTFTSPSPTPATGFKSLYNGNIGGMVTNIRQLNTPQYTYYHYDQLNRIKRMEALHGQNAAANTWTFGLRFNGYIESFTYDPNGNIKTLSRNSNVAQIDDLTYNYLAGTNKLTSVTDPISSGLVNYDIDGQAANNYSYDRIGNMTADNAEGITNISWTVYGKIKNITKSTGTIEYRYDASGNRIYKKTFISGATTETYYARDAQGNVMAVYEKQAANPLKWVEQHLYGSSRLGMWNLADVVPGTTIPASGGNVEDGYLYGSKFFELSNHLGNVLVTVSDKKIGIDDGGNGTTDYFQPEVLTAQDYFSFGQVMPGRQFGTLGRYGFNGKEQDKEVKGSGAQYDYGFRIYDPRLGRFLSVDPLTKEYPWYTPYQFAGNKPIWATDVDGLEENTTSTFAKKPIGILAKPAFAGIISVVDATGQTAHKTFEGDFIQLRRADRNGMAVDIANHFASLNTGDRSSRLDLTITGERSEISKTWKGSDKKYFVQFSYSFTNNNVTEVGTFEMQASQIQVSARVWDPVTYLLVNKVVSMVVGISVSTPHGKVVQSRSGESLQAAQEVYNGKTLYRLGTTGKSATGANAQYWSLENPLTMSAEEYAKKYGISLDNVKNADFVEVATLKSGVKYVTREAPIAPGAPAGAGGGIEAVVEKGGTTGNLIIPIKR
jgi:RHS repeat-associated protein